MIRRPARRCRLYPFKTHLRQIERIDRADRIALVDEIVEAFGQERPLPTICLLNEAKPSQNHRRIITRAQRFHTATVTS